MEEMNKPLLVCVAQSVDKWKASLSQTDANLLICMAVEVKLLLKNVQQLTTIQFCSIMIQPGCQDKHWV